mmetsp:Transcript_17305/g.40583  ORF Transcript_17305/g.40583 Transcript_17305/m.40583 type:complete len:332 (-) Transcript_17305:1712-2707(-)
MCSIGSLERPEELLEDVFRLLLYTFESVHDLPPLHQPLLMICRDVTPKFALHLDQALSQEVLQVKLLPFDFPVDLVALLIARLQRLLCVLQLLAELLQLGFLFFGEAPEGFALHLRFHGLDRCLVLGDVTLEICTPLLVLAESVLLPGDSTFCFVDRLCCGSQGGTLYTPLLEEIALPSLDLLDLVVRRLHLLLETDEARTNRIDFSLRLDHLLVQTQADEARWILIAPGQRPPTADLVPIHGNGVQAMLCAHLVTKLKGGADHGPAKDLLNCGVHALGALDHIHEGFRSFELGIRPRLHFQLVQRCADDTPEASFANQGNNLPGNVVIFH